MTSSDNKHRPLFKIHVDGKNAQDGQDGADGPDGHLAGEHGQSGQHATYPRSASHGGTIDLSIRADSRSQKIIIEGKAIPFGSDESRHAPVSQEIDENTDLHLSAVGGRGGDGGNGGNGGTGARGKKGKVRTIFTGSSAGGLFTESPHHTLAHTFLSTECLAWTSRSKWRAWRRRRRRWRREQRQPRWERRRYSSKGRG